MIPPREASLVNNSMRRGLKVLPTMPAPQRVMVVALVLLVAQLILRSWAAWFGWYAGDDLIFLRWADRSADPGYLFESYNGHLMPGGKLVFGLIGLAGSSAWWPAVVFLVVAQAVASLSFLWLLVTLFGRRWSIVPPFALYLFSPLAIPTYMWFVESTQQLPYQIALGLGLGSWVRYLRGEGRRWLIATAAVFVIGLFFREKVLLVLPVLLFVQLFYFTSGNLKSRVADLRTAAPGLATMLGLSVAYLVYYIGRTPSEFTVPSVEAALDLATRMLGMTLPTGLVGGPWDWQESGSPNSYSDPSGMMVTLAWVVVYSVLTYLLLRRRGAWPAALLLVLYSLGTYTMVLSARGVLFGGDLGGDVRFLCDLAIVSSLCLGLATMPIRGAQLCLTEREPAKIARVPKAASMTLLVLVVAGGALSSVTFSLPWHNNPAEDYFATLRTEMKARGGTDFADRALPDEVFSSLLNPYNSLSFAAPLVSQDARFTENSSSLFVVDDRGRVRPAHLDKILGSGPGKARGCGWRVRAPGRTIPLDGRAINYVWWIKIKYLASAPATVTLDAGESTVRVPIRVGLNDAFVHVRGTFDAVRIIDVDPGITICVDAIEVGDVSPGDPA